MPGTNSQRKVMKYHLKLHTSLRACKKKRQMASERSSHKERWVRFFYFLFFFSFFFFLLFLSFFFFLHFFTFF